VPFSGTIGRAAGTSWCGVAVMRSKAHARKHAKGSGRNIAKGELQKSYFNFLKEKKLPFLGDLNNEKRRRLKFALY
jgi:hypothetical protein